MPRDPLFVYRVAHNVATGHMIRQRRIRDRLVSIETIEAMPDSNEQAELAATQAEALDRSATPARMVIMSLGNRLPRGGRLPRRAREVCKAP